MAADMAAVIEAVRAAIEDAANAPRSLHPPYEEFHQGYGPGLRGADSEVEEGRFYVGASRYSSVTSSETIIVVNIVPDVGDNPYWAPSQREHLDCSTQEILAAVEAEFLMAGASLHHEGRGPEQREAPWRWFMTWVWGRRD